MASIAGKPFLEHQIRSLRKQGIEDIILAVHHRADMIKSHFGDGSRWGLNITYSEEEIPLGTAGAIKKAEKYIDDTFFVLNGDSYSEMDLKDFLKFHETKKSEVTMSLIKSPVDSLHYGNVIMEENKIVEFSEKVNKQSKLVNGGVYLFEPIIFDLIKPDKKISLEENIFPKLAKEKKLFGYPHSKYFIDIGRPETYSKFKKDFLESITLSSKNTIREAIKKIKENETSFIAVKDDKKKFKGILTERIIMNYLINEDSDPSEKVGEICVEPHEIIREGVDDEKISEKLAKGVKHLPIINEKNELIDIKFRSEEIKKNLFPIVRGRSPLRISFSGGGTDLPYFFEKYGGIVISSTIDKYCHATATKRADSKIIIESDLSKKEIILDIGNLEYDGEFDLIKSVFTVMKPDFGVDLYLHNDVPPGRGLGSSASLSVLVAKLISQLQGIKYSEDKLAKIAFEAEHDELKIKGGWQDQYAAVTGGFNFMEFSKDKTIIYPLKLKEEVINEFNSHLLLCYVGKSHFSGEQMGDREEIFLKNEEKSVVKFNKLKENAIEIKDCLLTGKLNKIGGLLHDAWENKRKLSDKVSNPRIDELYSSGIKNGAYGGKLLGSGGGGYILFFYSPKRRNQLVKSLKDIGGEIMDFNFESEGAKTWNSLEID